MIAVEEERNSTFFFSADKLSGGRNMKKIERVILPVYLSLVSTVGKVILKYWSMETALLISFLLKQDMETGKTKVMQMCLHREDEKKFTVLILFL